ncbi:sarcosine oxidase subunit beta family protein [Ostreibacterium oceani]|uniref:Sarcosine oxidase subunit beta n=1 Tax=Ostreibacterium oceani TaxID=2654998 RepID=A0A6N7EYW8_9GAMM|nr:sarcosine oxidase subunit beta family protein [Ostreibacterium oceani]MPV86357.1 sarcosine oxidase subunit beta family protein [Ostreibacterium oceani]
MQKYSALSLIKQAFSQHKNWQQAWRNPTPKSHYDVIIIGGGGHGLATAYYLAKNHGITNVAVIEKGYLGGGNVGRNTTIVRSNYLLPENNVFYEFGMKLWEKLSLDLNYNVMFSSRGVLNLAHTSGQLDGFRRRANAMRLQGVDAELLNRDAVKSFVPGINLDNERFPIHGGILQRRGGTARHDAVAWGYARAADAFGVDLIQQCEVTGFIRENNRIVGVHTNRGDIRAAKLGMAVAGSSSILAEKAGFRLPIESHVLQAFVTESIKPFLDTVVTYGAGHCYISQSDKGSLVFGGDLDMYNSYAQRGNLPVVEDVSALALQMFPQMSRLRLLRSWGGIMDMSMDGSPIIDKSPVDGLFVNAGWCYGGFKATPASGWAFAHTIATGDVHEINAGLRLNRFELGLSIDENGKGPVPKLH